MVDPFFALVAGDFFDPEHFTTKVDCAMDAGPQVSLFAFDRGLAPLEKEGEGVVNSLVVDMCTGHSAVETRCTRARVSARWAVWERPWIRALWLSQWSV